MELSSFWSIYIVIYFVLQEDTPLNIHYVTSVHKSRAFYVSWGLMNIQGFLLWIEVLVYLLFMFMWRAWEGQRRQRGDVRARALARMDGNIPQTEIVRVSPPIYELLYTKM